MRFLKLSIVSFFILFMIVTAIGLLFPSTVRVSRSVNISAPYDTIYHYLNDAKYWKLWMNGADSTTITFLSAKTSGGGTVIKIGTGKVIISRSLKDSIFTIWKSEKGNVQNSAFVLTNNFLKKIITVQWYFEQQVNWYPWERFGSLSNDKILGPVIERSFEKLKKVLEKK